jgi:hemerythrin-like domain-containing protein
VTVNLTEQTFAMGGYLDMHKAIRRQLERIVNESQYLSAEKVENIQRLQKRFNFYWEMVEHHHKTEDNGFFPMLVGMDAIFGSQLAELTEDHNWIDEQVLLVQNNLAATLASSDSELCQIYYNQFVTGLSSFKQRLFEHLEREEAAVMPAVCRHFFVEQQIGMEQQIVTGMPQAFLAKMFPWTFEILTEEEQAISYAHLPESIRADYAEWEARYYRDNGKY